MITVSLSADSVIKMRGKTLKESANVLGSRSHEATFFKSWLTNSRELRGQVFSLIIRIPCRSGWKRASGAHPSLESRGGFSVPDVRITDQVTFLPGSLRLHLSCYPWQPLP